MGVSVSDLGSDTRERDRRELIATVVLALAGILTAWSAFQSAKWSGLQSSAYSDAAAARTQANRQANLAAAEKSIDVNLFVQWLSAVAGKFGGELQGREYQPEPGTLDAFLFHRFRSEFKPALEAWLATQPSTNPDAPPSPFAMKEYSVAADLEAERLEQLANARIADAHTFDRHSDNYVAVTVLLAIVLFFAGVGPKLHGRRASQLMVVMAIVFLIGAIAVEAFLPVTLG